MKNRDIIEELCTLGESIREKLDKRSLRIINGPLSEEDFDLEKDRIQKEVVEKMETFLKLYYSIREK